MTLPQLRSIAESYAKLWSELGRDIETPEMDDS